MQQKIKDIRAQKNKKRISLKDVSFLIPLRIDSQSRLDNLTAIARYLDKYFDTQIIILESDKEPKIDKELLPDNCRYLFRYDESPLLHRTKINNELIRLASTPIIAIYDTDVIIPVQQIKQSVLLLKESKADMVYPYDGTFISVDSLFKEMFVKLLDDKLFITPHQEKFVVAMTRSFGGAVFINTQNYITAGGENENFTSWGPEDAERYKRMKILGYIVKRIKGNLYHLPHKRLLNSFYHSSNNRIVLMEEYLKVCKMKSTELKEYISNWSSIQSFNFSK